jgi:hypothetical protein
MADAGDSKSPAPRGCVGSTPTSGTSGRPGLPLATPALLRREGPETKRPGPLAGTGPGSGISGLLQGVMLDHWLASPVSNPSRKIAGYWQTTGW